MRQPGRLTPLALVALLLGCQRQPAETPAADEAPPMTMATVEVAPPPPAEPPKPEPKATPKPVAAVAKAEPLPDKRKCQGAKCGNLWGDSIGESFGAGGLGLRGILLLGLQLVQGFEGRGRRFILRFGLGRRRSWPVAIYCPDETLDQTVLIAPEARFQHAVLSLLGKTQQPSRPGFCAGGEVFRRGSFPNTGAQVLLRKDPG